MSRARNRLGSVRTEGGLLPQDVLARIQAGDKDLGGLDPASYNLGSHERVGEAVNRSWSRLTTLWHAFQSELAKVTDASRATGLTRDRWLLPLFEELRYGRLPKGQAIVVDGKSFAVSHTWQHSPIHLLGAGVDLDRRQSGVAGAAKASPHGLVQEFLNRSDNHLWGFVSNGLRLRILRDHHSLTRQAYVEFDLEAIMEGEQYSEFLLLWMVCHQSRVEADKPEECWLETWFNASREEGVRALDKLRHGVEKAIEAFGTGFLAHRGSSKLKAALESGELDKQEYYRQVLRLVYRLIFLFVAEERDALLDPLADDAGKNRYLRFYATRRLRELAEKRRGGPHGDLWKGLRLVMSKLHDGCPELGLPALGSRLWGPTACSWLMDADCANEHLLDAVRSLSTIQDGKTRYPVNWRNVGADELGSIYEGLLELHPRINKEAPTFELDTAAGHERKTTGSYYTPTSLVDCLLDSALDPVLDEASSKPDAEAAILDLKVCDPACGSGHFLVAAARRIAKRLAAVRAGEDEPSPREVQRALRDVVGRCIYGVDVNPMAVELCKVSLWMEAIEPGRPLSFLDSHIQCGNALLGATPALMARGIPNDAFKPIAGDDKEVAKKLKARNRKERKSKQLAFAFPPPLDSDVVDEFLACDESPDADLAAVREHEVCWLNLQRSNTYRDAWFRADAWCAAFVWPKHDDEVGYGAITESVWRRLQRDASTAGPAVRQTVRALAREYRFFHWHLAFPQVFAEATEEIADAATTGWAGGFDVVVGNPPWERVKLQEKEWFRARCPEIAAADTNNRRRLIAALSEESPALHLEFMEATRQAECVAQLLRNSGRYPMCGRGRDINTFAVFAELNVQLMGSSGYVGCIVPSGVATDDTTKFFFQHLVETTYLKSLYDFENRRRLFAIHSSTRFCLLTLQGPETAADDRGADFVFFAHQVGDLLQEERHFRLKANDIALINPNTRTCPVFRNRREARIAKEIYSKFPVLIRDASDELKEDNRWSIQTRPGHFHTRNHAKLLKRRADINPELVLAGNHFIKKTSVVRTSPETRAGASPDTWVPLFEAKMFHHFNHRWTSYDSRGIDVERTNVHLLANPSFVSVPRCWVRRDHFESALRGWSRRWVAGFREVTNSTNERTLVAAIAPLGAIGHKFPLFDSELAARDQAFLIACMSSFVVDFIARKSVGGTTMGIYVIKQLPIPDPSNWTLGFSHRSDTDLAWISDRFIELVYTAWDLECFAKDCGYDTAPFKWDDTRRFLLRCELDAAFFHMYGLARDDVAYVMETFPIVKRKDETAHGTYRTSVQILDIFDAMRRAIDTGEPYQTLLIPPPAASSRAHDENTRPSWVEPIEPARVIPFRRPTPQFPTWGPDILPAVAARWGAEGAGAWGSDQSGDDLLRYALAAVLRVVPEPWPSVDVQRAVVAVVWPSLIASRFDGDMEAEFRRLVGAAELSRPVQAIGNWHRQVRLAISHQLLRVEGDRWAAGPDVDDASDAALTARAAVTVAWILSESRDDAAFEPLEALLA